MKNSLFTALILSLIWLGGCQDYQALNLEEINSGNADFSNYVAVGNSLTAGYQNGALYRDAQEYSFPKLLARQLRVETDFGQPTVGNPGLGIVNGKAMGRLEVTSFSPLTVVRNKRAGSPIFRESNKPFENMGVPGSILIDYLNPGNQGNLKERSTDPQHPNFNPFYSFVLPNSELAKSEPNLHNQVVAQNPSFITFWLGNNDVLAFVTSGGQGQPITDASDFSQLYQASVQALQSTGASVVLYNIPDVTSIPFVFLLRSQLEQQEIIAYNTDTGTYQLVTDNGNFDIYINVDGNAEVMRQDDFLLLTASDYFERIQGGEITPPIDADGDGTPEATVPDRLVLDGSLGDGNQSNSELELAATAVDQFNAGISSAASSAGFPVVNINGIFNSILNDYQSNGGGYDASDITLQPLPGSLFSFDGIHPTNRGAAAITNETIKVMNSSYGSNVPLLDINNIPEGIPVN